MHIPEGVTLIREGESALQRVSSSFIFPTMAYVYKKSILSTGKVQVSFFHEESQRNLEAQDLLAKI